MKLADSIGYAYTVKFSTSEHRNKRMFIRKYMSDNSSPLGPSEFTHQPMESYVTTDSHKCYALQSGSHQLYIVYTDSIPTYAMRYRLHIYEFVSDL